MRYRWLVLVIVVMFTLAAVGIVATALATPVAGGIGNCGVRGKCTPAPTASGSTATPSPSATAAPTPSAAPAVSTAPSAPPTYTFDDEFSGTTLSGVWIRHYSCCGTLAGYDPTLVTVSGGYLHMSVVQRSTGWWGYLLDTKTTWTQTFGYFEARMQIPKGAGLWPAFWSYYSGTPELDTMEVCANPLGANGGNDASLLHQTVHYGSGSTLPFPTRTVDLSLGFHVYGLEWRADHVSFYLDGIRTGTTANTAAIPTGALPLIVNLGAGGSWCGAPGAPGTLLVDWIRVRA